MSDEAKHIRHTHARLANHSWCGVRLWSHDWVFQNLDHAAYNAAQGGFTVACPQCVERAVAALTQTEVKNTLFPKGDPDTPEVPS